MSQLEPSVPARKTTNPFVQPRDHVCPLLAGLNRMGCRGPHCQWWVPVESDEVGECAMVIIALRGQAVLSEELLTLLQQKRQRTKEWHDARQQEAEAAKAAARKVGYAASIVPPRTDEPRPTIEGEPGSGSNTLNEKLAKTVKGISQRDVDALWGTPDQVRSEGESTSYTYRLPGGKHLSLRFSQGILAQTLRW